MIPDHLTGPELVTWAIWATLVLLAALALVVYAGEAAFRAAARAWARRQARRVLDLPATPWSVAAVAFAVLFSALVLAVIRCNWEVVR